MVAACGGGNCREYGGRDDGGQGSSCEVVDYNGCGGLGNVAPHLLFIRFFYSYVQYWKKNSSIQNRKNPPTFYRVECNEYSDVA